jgi:hypothetical protein
MFLIEHVNGMILHRLVHFEGRRTGFWYRLIFVVSLYGLYLYLYCTRYVDTKYDISIYHIIYII